jgi:hypothetical protein
VREQAGWADVFAALARAGVAALGGERETALGELEQAVELADRWGMGLYAQVARLRRAQLAGDTAAAEAIVAQLRSLGVVRPDRVAAMLAPGIV